MKPTEQVSQLISALTNDEDQRQELWAHYLSGNAPSSLASHLDTINEEFTLDREIQSYLWQIIENPPSPKFQELLSHLSSIERSIVCLLALGCTVDKVAKYKGISETRIKQVISIIKENNCWEELYGIKEATNI